VRIVLEWFGHVRIDEAMMNKEELQPKTQNSVKEGKQSFVSCFCL
jgi:hypothetical protein